jgi:bisanhydrobacterioruberin hydratase
MAGAFFTKKIILTPLLGRSIIVIFYAVGLGGMLLPATRNLFFNLTPLALLLSAYMLYLFYKPNTRATLWFTVVYILAFAIEAIGVNTGLIFGHYKYGSALGIKLWETPLLIGLNWVMLLYTFLSVLQRYRLAMPWRVLITGLGMVMFDAVLEQVAPKTQMWYWLDNNVPWQNFLAWFIISVGLATILERTKTVPQNPMAATILITQFVFFVLLMLTL